MVSQSLDVTSEFNLNNGVKLDVGLWQNVIIHVSGSVSGTLSITGTNDGGAITGATGDSPQSSLNYTAIQATNMATAAQVTAVAAAGNFKVNNLTKYIQLGGANAATTGKVIFFLSTPA